MPRLGNRQKGCFSREAGTEAELPVREQVVGSDVIGNVIKKMAFKRFTNQGEKRNRAVVGRRR